MLISSPCVTAHEMTSTDAKTKVYAYVYTNLYPRF
jgi:hypothetical protein